MSTTADTAAAAVQGHADARRTARRDRLTAEDARSRVPFVRAAARINTDADVRAYIAGYVEGLMSYADEAERR